MASGSIVARLDRGFRLQPEETQIAGTPAMYPYPRHLDAFDYRGFHRYFLTFCTHNRRPIFIDRDRVTLVERHFLRTQEQLGFADLAHCFMPDHVHILVEGQSESSDARALIARMKQNTGFYFKKAFGERLWQRYAFERVLRDDEGTAEVVRYLIDNPVRAGLVASADEYPFIGSSKYTLEQLRNFSLDVELAQKWSSA